MSCAISNTMNASPILVWITDNARTILEHFHANVPVDTLDSDVTSKLVQLILCHYSAQFRSMSTFYFTPTIDARQRTVVQGKICNSKYVAMGVHMYIYTCTYIARNSNICIWSLIHDVGWETIELRFAINNNEPKCIGRHWNWTQHLNAHIQLT